MYCNRRDRDRGADGPRGAREPSRRSGGAGQLLAVSFLVVGFFRPQRGWRFFGAGFPGLRRYRDLSWANFWRSLRELFHPQAQRRALGPRIRTKSGDLLATVRDFGTTMDTNLTKKPEPPAL